MIRQVLFISFLFFTGLIAAQSSSWETARSNALVNSCVSDTNLESFGLNPSAMAHQEVWGILFNYENRFLIPELSNRSLIAALPVKRIGVFGAGIQSFGYRLYRENALSVAFAKQFGKQFSIGLRYDYLSLKWGEPRLQLDAWVADMGFQVMISKHLSLAARFYNPFRAKFQNNSFGTITSELHVGLQYAYSQSLRTYLALSQNVLDTQTSLRLGLEYDWNHLLYFRLGLSTYPRSLSFGLGLKWKKLHLCLASTYRHNLGFSPSVSLSIQPNKRLRE